MEMFVNMLGFISPELKSVISIIRIVLICVIVLACAIMIVTTLLQSSANQAGSSAISGGATESYFSQNRDNSRDGKLKRITITMAIIVAVCLVLYFLSGLFFTLTPEA